MIAHATYQLKTKRSSDLPKNANGIDNTKRPSESNMIVPRAKKIANFWTGIPANMFLVKNILTKLNCNLTDSRDFDINWMSQKNQTVNHV